MRPFSAKQKSKRLLTGMEGVLSCSCCLRRSEPPTKPIRHFLRRSERSAVMAGDMGWRAGVRVPSTSKRTIFCFRGRSAKGMIEVVLAVVDVVGWAIVAALVVLIN